MSHAEELKEASEQSCKSLPKKLIGGLLSRSQMRVNEHDEVALAV
jgi:hypothetical protein